MTRVAAGAALACSLLAACGSSVAPRDADTVQDAGSDAGAEADAGSDLGRDAFVFTIDGDASVDAGVDAGPTGLELDRAATRVDDCVGSPQLSWNGDGWALWWTDCVEDGPGHLRELDATGAPGDAITFPPLPPEAGTSPLWPDSLVFANGQYALGGRVWLGGETPSLGPYVAAVDRTGTATPWAPVELAFGVLVGGGDGTPGWWTEEYGTPDGTRLVVRDASMVEVSRSALSTAPGVGRARGRTRDLLWDGTAPMRTIAPYGTLADVADVSAPTPMRGWAWDDAFLLQAAAADPSAFDLVVLDPASPADTRAELPYADGPSDVAPIPEENRAATCWTRNEPQPDGSYGFAVYVQLVDLAAGTVLGAPTRVITETEAVRAPTCAWSGSRLVVVWSPFAATFAASYRVVP